MFYTFSFDSKIRFSLVVIILTVILTGLSMLTYDSYAQQQGGSATSGSATGGSATAGGLTISGSCYQCTITNAPQATGGEAASGSATGGEAASGSATGG